MTRLLRAVVVAAAIPALVGLSSAAAAAESWTQLKFDARRSGDAPDRRVAEPLGLVAAAPLTDAVFTSPVVAEGRVFVVDGSGVAHCLDAASLRPIWKRETDGGPINCNNVSSPLVAGEYLHFGTMGGNYYVLRAADGSVVKKIPCGEPILSSPVATNDRVYFATLGSRVHALTPEGEVCWTWDYVRERLGFEGDRYCGQAWLEHKGGRVTWRDQFLCTADLAAFDRTIVVPAGGETVWLEDAGPRPELRGVGLVPGYKGSEPPATFGLSVGDDGSVYRQWHRRDNTGRVEILRRRDDGTFEIGQAPGTLTQNDMPGLLSFSSVSLRGKDVFRCRPEEGFGFCLHRPGEEEPVRLGAYPSIAAPILAGDRGIVGGLDGRLYVVPLDGGGPGWSFATAFGCPISAPAAVAGGRIYFGCEDGYVYALGPGGNAPLPERDLEVWRVRTPLGGEMADAKYDWFSHFRDQANTNANDQGLRPPLALQWIRRYEGTFKHLPVCGGGRMYTHTAEGQIFAVEQSTGRLLWRRYWPGVFVCFTSPIYWQEKLVVPQAGLERSRMRCLDAATGALVWEAPFTGSPSWSRPQPPVIWQNRVIYMFGTGRYVPKGTGLYVMRGAVPVAPLPESTEGQVSWLYSHDNPFYPPEHRPMVRAWDLDSGEVVWERDFSEHGAGGDHSAVCLMDDTVFYSVFFGYAARRRGQPGPKGLTAALDPATGATRWLTTDYSMTAGCTISGENGRIYLGGYNPPAAETNDRYVWCLDARDGSFVWRSEPVTRAINVVTVASRFLLAFAYGGDSALIDKADGKVLCRYSFRHACTRLGFSEPYAIATNLDLIDLSDPAAGPKLVWSGPAVEPRECVGGIVSNGRVFYTSQSSGVQMSMVYGEEAERARADRRALD